MCLSDRNAIIACMHLILYVWAAASSLSALMPHDWLTYDGLKGTLHTGYEHAFAADRPLQRSKLTAHQHH